MRFTMLTTIAASVAVAIAMPALELDGRQAGRLCNANGGSNAVCCATDIVGAAALDCGPREFQPQL